MNSDFWKALAEQIISRFQTNFSAIFTILLFILAGWVVAFFTIRLVKRIINSSNLNQVYQKSRLAQEMGRTPTRTQPG